MSDLIPLAVALKSRSIYVILMKDDSGNLTLLADPGMNLPWSSKNKRLADFHAGKCGGEARTWEEAFNLLKKEYPQFEHDLHARIAAVNSPIINDIVKPKPNAKRN